MALVEGKNPSERRKMIVAGVLGAIAIISLGYMLLGGSSTKTVTTNSNKSKTTSASGSVRTNVAPFGAKPQEEFIPGIINADFQQPAVPEAGRNIFAFYVPPKPVPKPSVIPTPIPTPPPVPPNVIVSSISPVNVYAHTGDFTLDVTGDKFTAETRIFVGGAELATRFVSPQQLSAKVPAQLISFEGAREVEVKSRDGQLFSNKATMNVMPAPVPNVTFIGVINRTGSNDTAILKDKNGRDIMNVQRGDLVGGRFRVTSISVRDVVLTDTTIKIKHTLPLTGDNSNPAGGRPPYQPPPPPTSEDNEP